MIEDFTLDPSCPKCLSGNVMLRYCVHAIDGMEDFRSEWFDVNCQKCGFSWLMHVHVPTSQEA